MCGESESMRSSTLISGSTILTLAAVCGVATFGYVLVTQAPRSSGGRGWSSRGMMATPGDTPRDIPGLEAALEANPRRGDYWFTLARLYEAADRDDDAKRAWEEAAPRRLANARNRDPQNPHAWFEAGWAYWKLGKTDEAKEPLERAEVLFTEAQSKTALDWGRLGWARKLTGKGQQDAAIAWDRARDIMAKAANSGGIAGDLYDLACYQSLLEDRDTALATLDLAVRSGWRNAGWASHDEDLENIRDDPRFKELILTMRQLEMGVRIEKGP